jgi:hypothetical protein
MSEDEVVSAVLKWSAGRDVLQLIRSIREVYHGSNLVQLDAKYMDASKPLNAKEVRVAFLRTYRVLSLLFFSCLL